MDAANHLIMRFKKRKEIVFLLFILTPFYLPYVLSYALGKLTLPEAYNLIIASSYNLLIFLPLILIKRNSKGMYIFLFSLQTLFATLQLFYISTYKTPISESTFFIIFETNLYEVLEYLADYLPYGKKLLGSLMLQLVVLSFLIIRFRNISMRSVSRYYLIVCAFPLLTLANKGMHHIAYRNTIVMLISSYRAYETEHQKIKDLASKRIAEIEDVAITKPYPGEETYILILGESTNRHHLGLYGYVRNTNPMLKKIENELFVFRDVISPSPHTIPSLSTMLTFANYENTNSFYTKGSLIQYLKKAGFRTYWISNQVPMGINENLATLLAKSSDSLIFVNNNKHYEEVSLDEKVLIPLKRVINEKYPKKFIIVHLMGTHVNYCLRYPDKFSYFKDNIKDIGNDIINCYDNATLYNDYIIYEIIKLVKEKKICSFVLYVSDHGEEVFDTMDFHGHSDTIGTKQMFDIPFILWVSDKYRNFNRDKVSNFPNYLDRKYLNDDLLYSIFDLVNMQFKSYEPTRSIFSKDFKFKKRFIGTRDYDSDIARINNLFEVKQNVFNRQSEEFRQKVWAHRVDSIGKLKEVVKIFNGLELDIVFLKDKGVFDVGHPPTKSIGLTLEHFLGSIENPEKFKYWLDFKNLSKENQKSALYRLEYISDKFKLKRRNIIVESMMPLLLADFKEAGFFTSYYLPPQFLEEIRNKKTNDLSDKELETIKGINRKFKESGVDAVSTSDDNYDFINRYLSDVRNILLWNTSLEHYKYPDFDKIKQIIGKDKRIKVLLVKYRSAYDR